MKLSLGRRVLAIQCPSTTHWIICSFGVCFLDLSLHFFSSLFLSNNGKCAHHPAENEETQERTGRGETIKGRGQKKNIYIMCMQG